jgi:hypothetical protein
MTFAKFIGVAFALIIVVNGVRDLTTGSTGTDSTGSSGNTTKVASKGSSSPPEASVKLQDAAKVGDVVTLRYPNSTILCGDRNDAYLAGVVAMSQTYRIENSSHKAYAAGSAAKKIAMREAYSCRWPAEGIRYTVTEKTITGTKDDAHHVVTYGLRPVGSVKTVWLDGTFDWSTDFDVVESSAL